VLTYCIKSRKFGVSWSGLCSGGFGELDG